jgi:Raf kinase inhibitor-like YbhB/YbcL family protein
MLLRRCLNRTFWLGFFLTVGLAVCPMAAQSTAHLIPVESPVMADGETIPRVHTPDGRNLSPPLTWSQLPEGTRELAVVCADFGAGNPPPWVHWIIYSIPATASGLPEGLPIVSDRQMPAEISGSIQGFNSWGRPYYRGPAPPTGTPHLYHFTVYALDAALGLESGLTREEFLEAVDGHIIGRGELVPVYERFASPE